MSNIDARKRWNLVESEVASAWLEKKWEKALFKLDTFLGTCDVEELCSEAFAYRAHTKEYLGFPEAAIEDLVKAHATSKEGSFARYTMELSLGALCKKEKRPADALNWYLAALGTTACGSGFSCGSSLQNYLELAGGVARSEDQKLIEDAVSQSWIYLDIGGKPDLTDLSQVGRILRERERKAARDAQVCGRRAEEQ